MTSSTPQPQADKTPRPRPLSPHLQIYRLPLTAVTSILHRMTGVALSVGLLVFTWGLMALAYGPEAFAVFRDIAGSVIGKIILFGWSLAFFYHFCSGIRHLVMDTASFMDIKRAYVMAYAVYIGAIVLTLAAWIAYFATRSV